MLKKFFWLIVALFRADSIDFLLKPQIFVHFCDKRGRLPSSKGRILSEQDVAFARLSPHFFVRTGPRFAGQNREIWSEPGSGLKGNYQRTFDLRPDNCNNLIHHSTFLNTDPNVS